MKMKIVYVLLAVTVARVASMCEENRKVKFDHGFADQMVQETGVDLNPRFGDFETVTLFKPIDIFGNVVTAVEIYDNGAVYFSHPASGVKLDGFQADIDYTENITMSFAAGIFLQEVSEVDYKFRYRHILRDDIDIDDGLNRAPDLCEFQQIESMVYDCNDLGNRYGTATGDARIREAIIITWEISDPANTYRFQTVIASTYGLSSTQETFVIFLYITPTSEFLRSFDINNVIAMVNGHWEATPMYAKGCVPNLTELTKISNCRCGSMYKGVFVFATKDNSVAAGEPTSNICSMSLSEFEAQCILAWSFDTWQNYQANCRPYRYPEETCHEQLTCREDADGNILITMRFNNPAYSDVGFLNYTEITENNITVILCQQELTLVNGMIYGTEFTLDPDNITCGLQYNPSNSETKFAVLLFNATGNEDATIVQAGEVTMMQTCYTLPKSLNTIDSVGVIERVETDVVQARHVDMVISKERRWSHEGVSVVNNGDSVALGEDIFMTVAYSWGSDEPTVGTEPFGFYVKDCYVSNNGGILGSQFGAAFRKIQLVNDSELTAYARDPENAFSVEDDFRCVFADPTAGTDIYNYVQMSGKIDASRWILGGFAGVIFFHCAIEFCVNPDDSQCPAMSECDVTAGIVREKRSSNSAKPKTYPSVTVGTSIRLVRPYDPVRQTDVQCVDNTLAITLLSSMTLLLVSAACVTAVLSVKVKRRRRRKNA